MLFRVVCSSSLCMMVWCFVCVCCLVLRQSAPTVIPLNYSQSGSTPPRATQRNATTPRTQPTRHTQTRMPQMTPSSFHTSIPLSCASGPFLCVLRVVFWCWLLLLFVCLFPFCFAAGFSPSALWIAGPRDRQRQHDNNNQTKHRKTRRERGTETKGRGRGRRRRGWWGWKGQVWRGDTKVDESCKMHEEMENRLCVYGIDVPSSR